MIALRQVNPDEIFRFDDEKRRQRDRFKWNKNYTMIPFKFEECELPRVNQSTSGRGSFPAIAIATLRGLLHAKESCL
jgi:hypothetical protein